MLVFQGLVMVHVLAGTVALFSFWVPIFARKGAGHHVRWGRIFAQAVTLAALLACAMGILNLTLTDTRHPILLDRGVFRGLFGWMMLYLGLLSLLLIRYGLIAVRNKRGRAATQARLNQAGMAVVAIAALQCGFQGVLVHQPLMVALAGLGLITVATFLRASLRPAVGQSYIAEHLKAMVAAGISAYTAFLSVGLLRIVPAQVFNPLIWSLPSVVGVMLIIHNLRILPRTVSRP
jgi:hypothetical protein